MIIESRMTEQIIKHVFMEGITQEQRDIVESRLGTQMDMLGAIKVLSYAPPMKSHYLGFHLYGCSLGVDAQDETSKSSVNFHIAGFSEAKIEKVERIIASLTSGYSFKNGEQELRIKPRVYKGLSPLDMPYMIKALEETPFLTDGKIPILERTNYYEGVPQDEYFYAGVFHFDDSTVGLQINGEQKTGRLIVASPTTSGLRSLESRLDRNRTDFLKRRIF